MISFIPLPSLSSSVPNVDMGKIVAAIDHVNIGFKTVFPNGEPEVRYNKAMVLAPTNVDIEPMRKTAHDPIRYLNDDYPSEVARQCLSLLEYKSDYVCFGFIYTPIDGNHHKHVHDYEIKRGVYQPQICFAWIFEPATVVFDIDGTEREMVFQPGCRAFAINAGFVHWTTTATSAQLWGIPLLAKNHPAFVKAHIEKSKELLGPNWADHVLFTHTDSWMMGHNDLYEGQTFV